MNTQAGDASPDLKGKQLQYTMYTVIAQTVFCFNANRALIHQDLKNGSVFKISLII